MSFRAAALAAVFLVGCDGCKGPSQAGPGTDAAPSASASTVAAVLDAGPAKGGDKPVDKTLVAVAEGSSDVRMLRTSDGSIVIVSGSTPFEAKANGTLEPLVTGAGLAPLYPDDDTFVGFLAPSTNVHWVRGDLHGASPFLVDGFAGSARKTFTVRDGKLIPAAVPMEAHHVVRWRGKLFGASFGSRHNELGWIDDKSEPAPPPIAKLSGITALAVDAQGALVVMNTPSYEKPRAAIFPATWKPGDAPTIVEGAQAAYCAPVSSLDASVVVRCTQNAPTYGDGTKFYRVSAAGFEHVFREATQSVGDASIGKDGALYVTSPRKIAVDRCAPPAGNCMPLAIKTDFAPLDKAQYEWDVSDVVERKGEFDMGDRSWTTIKVESSPTKDDLSGSVSVLARDESDVWLFARNYRHGVLFHATDDAQRARARLPSQLDGRLMAKNAAPPQLWTGHCEQVFVRLGAEDAKRGADIEKTLGAKSLAYDSPFHWWVVEGRLHEDKVAGVMLVRRDAEEALDKMERATEKLVDAFTPNPMSKPKVYCTLPVLDRVLYPGKP